MFSGTVVPENVRQQQQQAGPHHPKLRRFNCIFSTVISVVIAGLLVYAMCKGIHAHNFDHYPRLKVGSILMLPLNISSNNQSVSAKWIVEISVKNNLHDVRFYKKIQASVYYSIRNELLSSAKMEDFEQEVNEETRSMVDLKALLEYPVAQFMIEVLERNNGSISFDLKFDYISSTGSFGLGLFDFVCKDLKVRFSSPSSTGMLEGSSNNCSTSLIQ